MKQPYAAFQRIQMKRPQYLISWWKIGATVEQSQEQAIREDIKRARKLKRTK